MLSIVLFLAAVSCLVAVLRLRPRRRSRRTLFVTSVVGFCVLAGIWLLLSDPFDVRKVVGVCLMPVGILWLGLLALAWRLSGGRRRRIAVAAWALWAGFTLAGNVWVGQAMMHWLERPYEGIDPLELSPFDAVLVLGGGIDQHDRGQVYLAEAGDRVMLAARLYHAGKVELLLTSGAGLDCGPLPPTTMPRITAWVWQELGIPAERIILLEGPRSTTEEIAELASLLEQHSWQRVGLITSASHLRRALRLCRRAGVTVTPLPADFLSSSFTPRPMHLVPQSDGFRSVQRATWEIVGAAVGR